MGFYSLSKEERQRLVKDINEKILNDLTQQKTSFILLYSANEDTYIRKTTYLSIGRIYKSHPELHPTLLNTLNNLIKREEEKIRQTAINAAGEIGILNFESIRHLMDLGLHDPHHSVRNAVIGSMKKMGEKNPIPILEWAQPYLTHDNQEIRREVCHGLELRGRTHPEEILPLLRVLEFEKTPRVRNTLIHVIGQIAYKKGCLSKVISDLNTWNNTSLIRECLDEIIDVHKRYARFADLSVDQAKEYIKNNSSYV